jgi:alpha-L-fucosidase 2
LWEHYLFTGDKQFLAHRAYPAMKGACLFFMDYLVEAPGTDWLVTSPSHSPEQGPLCIGPAMDQQLIRALMDATLEAAKILGHDRAFARELARVRARVAPDQVGRHGQLQEWLDDIDTPNNTHRHMSPLFALYPGNEITTETPRLYEAAKVLLRWRGDGSTGWSYAWRMPLWARVGDGNVSFRQFEGLLQRRTLPNLFDLCGPFQIDGNFGAAAGVIEMLAQSHLDHPEATGTSHPHRVRIIDLLPALPDNWTDGRVTGLRARDGFELDLAWRAGELDRVTVQSDLGRPLILRHGSRSIRFNTTPAARYTFNSRLQPVDPEDL